MSSLHHDVSFRDDNTEGYSAEDLDRLNAELEQRPIGIEPGTDEYYETAKSFHDEVARR